jgi:hypothetical protein
MKNNNTLCLLLSFGALLKIEVVNATKINTIYLGDRIIGQDQFGFPIHLTNNVFHKIKDNQVFEYKKYFQENN